MIQRIAAAVATNAPQVQNAKKHQISSLAVMESAQPIVQACNAIPPMTPQTAASAGKSVAWDKYVRLAHVKQALELRLAMENPSIHPKTPPTAVCVATYVALGKYAKMEHAQQAQV